MLHSILRNTPFSLLVISVLFSGILSIATAQTTGTAASMSIDARVETKMTVSDDSATSTPEMQARRKAFEARVAEFKANVAARKEALTTNIAARRARISEKVETRVRTVITDMQSRQKQAIERLGAITDRIESRARTMAAGSTNVDASLALIAQARVELRAASVIINEDLAVEADAAVTAAEPKVAFEQIKQSVREATDHIQKAQKALRDAIAALKAITPTQVRTSGTVEATTTAR